MVIKLTKTTAYIKKAFEQMFEGEYVVMEWIFEQLSNLARIIRNPVFLLGLLFVIIIDKMRKN
jgi:hypothetical protein